MVFLLLAMLTVWLLLSCLYLVVVSVFVQCSSSMGMCLSCSLSLSVVVPIVMGSPSSPVGAFISCPVVIGFHFLF